MARPKEYNTETLKRICSYIVDGLTLTEVARKLGVSRQAIYKWRIADEKFAEMYAEAQKIRAEDLSHEIINIADDESRDVFVDPETGKKTANNAAVQRDKLKVQARTRLLQWLDPKRYADNQRIDITSNGENIYGGLMITPPKGDDDE